MRTDQFPIIGTSWCVPFAIVKRHARQCQSNHMQTPERLRERGGLCWSELCAVLQNKPYERIDEWYAQCKCVALIHDWEESRTCAPLP
jgi:hypothetical protein